MMNETAKSKKPERMKRPVRIQLLFDEIIKVEKMMASATAHHEA
jgi:hypothetical protein